MDPIAYIREKAKKELKTIILPEAEDERVIRAGVQAAAGGMAKIVFVGKADETAAKIENYARGDYPISVEDPSSSVFFEELLELLYLKRRHRDPDKDKYAELLRADKLYFAAMMTAAEKGSGFVAGAQNTTGSVVRASISCLGVDKTVKVASGSFVIYAEGCNYGEQGLFLFADCGLVPDPDPRQLGGIAVSSARLYERLFDRQAKVAMLSYSTKASAGGPMVDKVREALKEAKKIDSQVVIDGELQVDSALDMEVANKKTSVKGSPVAGRANVLIFPNLDAGNIGYKLVQRLAKARAIGPLIQGLEKPASDLSRGCAVEDIIDAICITAIRAQKR